MQESLGYGRGRISRSRGTGRPPPSLARREVARRSRGARIHTYSEMAILTNSSEDISPLAIK